jgi:hypothetical protein
VSHRRYLRSEKAAEKLDVAVGTLANWRSKMTGPPFYRRGGLVLYDADELDLWVERGRQLPAFDSAGEPAGAAPAQHRVGAVGDGEDADDSTAAARARRATAPLRRPALGGGGRRPKAPGASGI